MHLRQLAVFLLVLLTFAAIAVAGPFTSVIVYGDSLSDNGNLYAATGQPAAPYWQGRHSNGPMPVEVLAAQLGAPLFNLAWCGATTGIGNYGDGGTATTFGLYGLPGMASEFALSAAAIAPLASTSLVVIWGGPNDFLSPAPEDGGDPFKTADRGVAGLLALVADVQSIGAQHILVPGMADLGLTPYFQSMGMGAIGSGLTDYFNAQLLAGLPAGVVYFDTAGFMRQIVSNPGLYGFSNVTDACYDSGSSAVCGSPGTYLFFDDFHPTAAANSMLGDKFTTAVVPEPATYAMVASALAFVALGRRFRR